MTELLMQKAANGVFVPYDPDSVDSAREIIENRIITFRVVSQNVQKKRSVKQFNLFHAALRVVAFNALDRDWNTLDQAKISLKVKLKYYDKNLIVVLPNKKVVIPFRSFGFKYLKHMESCEVFSRSWPILAEVIGTTEQELIQAAKEKRYK